MTNVVYISGITGFIGRHVAKELVLQGYEVIGLVRFFNETSKGLLSKNIQLLEADLTNRNLVLNAPVGATLIHCAWDNASEHNSLVHIEKHCMDHYFFLKNMLTQGFKKIIVTGSCIEYGKQHGPINANSKTAPNTAYALSKDFLHKSLNLLKAEIEFNLIWARLFYIYGEGQFHKNIIPLFDAALERGDASFDMSLGEQLFDYLPVEEAAKKIISLLIYENGVFNICSGKPISLRRLLEGRMIEKGKKIKLNLGCYDYRKNESLAIWGDS